MKDRAPLEEKVRYSQVNDPLEWRTDGAGLVATFEDQAVAKEAARRWNAYPGLIEVLRKIATPALGGKQQQYMAQAALKELGE